MPKVGKYVSSSSCSVFVSVVCAVMSKTAEDEDADVDGKNSQMTISICQGGKCCGTEDLLPDDLSKDPSLFT